MIRHFVDSTYHRFWMLLKALPQHHLWGKLVNFFEWLGREQDSGEVITAFQQIEIWQKCAFSCCPTKAEDSATYWSESDRNWSRGKTKQIHFKNLIAHSSLVHSLSDWDSFNFSWLWIEHVQEPSADILRLTSGSSLSMAWVSRFSSERRSKSR